MNKLAVHVMLGPRERKKVKDCVHFFFFFYFSDNSSSAVKTIELIEKKKKLPVA